MYANKFKNWCDQSEIIPENCMIYNELLKMFQEADEEIEKKDAQINALLEMYSSLKRTIV